MTMFDYDELSIYRGKDIQVAKNIILHQPSLGEIEEFGEKTYWSAIYTLTAVGADLKWQLYEKGIDYTTITDYDLFIKLISQLVSSKKNILKQMTNEQIKDLTSEELEDFKKNPLQLILKDIDLADFKIYTANINNELVLYNKEKDITIDKIVYVTIVGIIRKMHGFKRNNQKPGNERTKMDLIEDARDEYLASLHKPFKSVLQPLVSTMINSEGFKYNHEDVWNMKINAFFDSVKRIGKIQDAHLLLQGAYSGFASLKGIDKERLNYAGELN